jgi:hypothetical protein
VLVRSWRWKFGCRSLSVDLAGWRRRILREILILAMARTGDTPRVPLTFLEALSRAPLLIKWPCPQGKPQIVRIRRRRRVNVFLLVDGMVSELASTWGMVDGWLLRQLAWRLYGQFGNGDASSRAWVAVWASLGCYRRVRWVLSCFDVSL